MVLETHIPGVSNTNNTKKGIVRSKHLPLPSELLGRQVLSVVLGLGLSLRRAHLENGHFLRAVPESAQIWDGTWPVLSLSR